jgi:transcriptional regulator with XRE-family HTH domain
MKNCIKQLRKQKSLTQVELARRIGIQQYRLSLIENNKINDLRFSTVRKIAEVLNISLDELFPT